jgi:hypothetical protein
MKLFLVSTGCYSDYRICGIYTTEEKAIEAKVIFLADHIEEMEADSIPEHPPGMLRFDVEMNREGDVINVHRRSVEYSINYDWVPYSDGVRVVFKTWAKDEKHAIKIANERRVALLATDQWTTDWNVWEKAYSGNHIK